MNLLFGHLARTPQGYNFSKNSIEPFRAKSKQICVQMYA